MSTLSLSVQVASTPGTLELNDGVNYKTVAYSPPARIRRRVVQTSDTVDGGVITSAVLDIDDLALAVRCLGTSVSQVATNAQNLITYTDDFDFQVTLTIAGVPSTYLVLCPADVRLATPDGSDTADLDKFQLMAKQHVYRLTMPCDPIRLAGVL